MQPDPPEIELETSSEEDKGALPRFNATTYVPRVHVAGRGGSLRYRRPMGDASPEVLYREPEHHLSTISVKVNFIPLPITLISLLHYEAKIDIESKINVMLGFKRRPLYRKFYCIPFVLLC